MPRGQETPVINGMKLCPKCGQTKPVSEYYASSTSRWGVRSPCKQCLLGKERQRYAQDGSSGKRRNARRIAKRYEIKQQLVEMMGGKCSVCGYDKSIYALDFHHEGEKDGQIATMIYRASNGDKELLQQTISEVAKCVLVCANCHREIHHELGA